MLICKDCGREVRKDDVCCPGCGSTDIVMNNYTEKLTPKTAFKKFFFDVRNFKGRSGRNEFWKAVIGNIVAALVFCIFVAVVAGVVAYPTFLRIEKNAILNEMDTISLIFIGMCIVVAIVYCIWITISWFALYARRMHDIGKSGSLALLNLVPGVGAIILMLLSIADSQPEINKYGTNPKVDIAA